MICDNSKKFPLFFVFFPVSHYRFVPLRDTLLYHINIQPSFMFKLSFKQCRIWFLRSRTLVFCAIITDNIIFDLYSLFPYYKKSQTTCTYAVYTFVIPNTSLKLTTLPCLLLHYWNHYFSIWWCNIDTIPCEGKLWFRLRELTDSNDVSLNNNLTDDVKLNLCIIYF